jgi:hypothetical protein
MAETKLPVRELIRRAQRGDEAAFKELRRLLDMEPSLWLEFGDLGTMAETNWLLAIAGEQNRLFREGISHRLDTLRSDLQSEGASPLEKLLIDRVCLTWLAVHYTELKKVQLMKDGSLTWEAGEEAVLNGRAR